MDVTVYTLTIAHDNTVRIKHRKVQQGQNNKTGFEASVLARLFEPLYLEGLLKCP